MKFEDNAPFPTLAFKVANDLLAGLYIHKNIFWNDKIRHWNSNTSKDKEESWRMLLMHAILKILKAVADNRSFAWIKNTITDHTLANKSHPILLELMEFQINSSKLP